MTLGQMLTERLQELGLSQAELVRLLARRGCEVSPQAVSAWCSDYRRPHLAHLVALLDALVIIGAARAAAIELAAAPAPVPTTNHPEVV